MLFDPNLPVPPPACHLAAVQDFGRRGRCGQTGANWASSQEWILNGTEGLIPAQPVFWEGGLGADVNFRELFHNPIYIVIPNFTSQKEQEFTKIHL